MTKWEYLTAPILTHAAKQILDNFGADGWELVPVTDKRDPGAGFVGEGQQRQGGVLVDHARLVDLEATLGRARQSNGYDALVALSGGKDSLYLLHRLSVDYGLKVLAFTVDANIPEVAWRSIRRTIDVLGVDLDDLAREHPERLGHGQRPPTAARVSMPGSVRGSVTTPVTGSVKVRATGV